MAQSKEGVKVDPVQRFISNMSRTELEQLALSVSLVLYQDANEAGHWDSDREWGVDDLSYITDILGFHGVYRAIEDAEEQ